MTELSADPGSALLGRDAELAELAGLLNTHRLVTVTGIGGVGKTRLAEVAAAAFPERATCLLLRHYDPTQVPTAVAEAAGFDSWESALVALADRDLVLLLDNCEHVLDAAADVVEALLAEAPGVRILATSREPLAVAGEQLFRLAPLALAVGNDPQEAAASPAVQLFLARAAAVGVPLTLEDAAVAAEVAELCRRLDGLPLAIELAAARTPALTPAEILGHLDHRLHLLVGNRRIPARHRSLEAMVDWSYDRLEPDTRRFFDWIGVRKGVFTAEAAHAVAAAPGDDLLRSIDHLDRLVSCSLVQTRRRGGRTFYVLLETLRDYARARLDSRGELDAAVGRCVNSTVRECAQWRERTQRSWSADLALATEALRHDLHDALNYVLTVDADPDRAHRLCIPFWRSVGHTDRAGPIADLTERVLMRWPDREIDGWAEVAAVAATAHIGAGDLTRATELGRQSFAAARTPFASFVAARALLLASVAREDVDSALALAAEAAEIARNHNLLPWRIEVDSVRAIALSARSPERALTVAAAACRDADRTDSLHLQMWCRLVHAHLLALVDPVAARSTFAELSADVPSWFPLGAALAGRACGALDIAAGRVEAGARAVSVSLESFVAHGLGSAQVRATLVFAAQVAHLSNRPAEAAELRTAAGFAPPHNLSGLLARASGVSTGVATPVPAAAPPQPLRHALTVARDVLGQASSAATCEAGSSAGDGAPAPGPTAEFRREGALWVLSYQGLTVWLPDAKGLHDLAALLAAPGTEIRSLDLIGAAVTEPDTGPALDVQARRAYQRRIRELQAEIDDAGEFGDQPRADKARLELEFLLDQLSAATGLAGRDRRPGGTEEKARSAVTWRIRAALTRITEAHPALGEHLRASVQTGIRCSYRPQHLAHWSV